MAKQNEGGLSWKAAPVSQHENMKRGWMKVKTSFCVVHVISSTVENLEIDLGCICLQRSTDDRIDHTLSSRKDALRKG